MRWQRRVKAYIPDNIAAQKVFSIIGRTPRQWQQVTFKNIHAVLDKDLEALSTHMTWDKRLAMRNMHAACRAREQSRVQRQTGKVITSMTQREVTREPEDCIMTDAKLVQGVEVTPAHLVSAPGDIHTVLTGYMRDE